MSSLLTAASAIMSSSERRLEVIANNVANVSTPGYRRPVTYYDSVTPQSFTEFASPLAKTRVDESQGRLTMTNNPLDVAISGEGFFQLRTESGMVYSRQGQFSRGEDGTIVNAHGHVLQQVGGGDLIVDGGEPEVLADGIVMSAERPIGRVAVFAPAEGVAAEAISGSTFHIADAEEIEVSQLRQGMIESSNVVLGDEMVAMMTALRYAETGARLATTWDELMGRAIGTLGQAR